MEQLRQLIYEIRKKNNRMNTDDYQLLLNNFFHRKNLLYAYINNGLVFTKLNQVDLSDRLCNTNH